MKEFDALARSLRGESLEMAAEALFRALSGQRTYAADRTAEVPSTAGQALPDGPEAVGERGESRDFGEDMAAYRAAEPPAETAAERDRVLAEFGEAGGAVYASPVFGENGGAAAPGARLRTPAVVHTAEAAGAEALSEAFRRDSRRYDRVLE